MEYLADFTEVARVAQNPLSFILWILAKTWVLFVIGFIFGYGIPGYLEFKRNKYHAKRQFILLAIDIPKDNEQSPKAVESIFAQLTGISTKQNLYEKWIKGMTTESFSFEIVSMGGYVQFLIYAPVQFRDLVEAAIYAQYPDAEIVEVEDYAQKTRGLKFPHPEYDMWGTEFVITGNQYFPIKTYIEFEHSLSKEFFKDPMSSLMEALGKIGPDEQIWMQLVVTPAHDSWKDEGGSFVKKLIGEKMESKKNFVDKISDVPINLVYSLGDISALYGAQEKEKQQQQVPNRMQFLTPGQKSGVESVERKMSKIGFHTKFRAIYIARKQAFLKPRGVSPLYGAIKQFNVVGQNGFKTSKILTPSIDYFFKNLRNNSRKNRVLRLFRGRSSTLRPGYYGYVLNTEELATLYHFPVKTVRAPLLKRVESKKSEPPSSLPIETEIGAGEVPDNLPVEKPKKS